MSVLPNPVLCSSKSMDLDLNPHPSIWAWVRASVAQIKVETSGKGQFRITLGAPFFPWQGQVTPFSHSQEKKCSFPACSIHPSAPHLPHREPRLPRDIPVLLYPQRGYLLLCHSERAERLHHSSHKAFHSSLPARSWSKFSSTAALACTTLLDVAVTNVHPSSKEEQPWNCKGNWDQQRYKTVFWHLTAFDLAALNVSHAGLQVQYRSAI